MSRSGVELSRDLQRGRINYGYAAARLLSAVVPYPQVFLVMLQGDACRFRPGINVREHFPSGGINDGHLINERHGDVEPLFVAAHDPVFAGAAQGDQGVQFAVAEAEERVYN